jgi:hypothetical protein
VAIVMLKNRTEPGRRAVHQTRPHVRGVGRSVGRTKNRHPIDLAPSASNDLARRRSGASPEEESVLIDHRYYRIKPGMVPAHLDLYEKTGFAAQSRHLGQPFAYLFTESGEVNTLVHMWLYDDVADRARKRAAMAADPEWQNYLRLNNEAGYTVSQQNNLMLPAKFAPLKR